MRLHAAAHGIAERAEDKGCCQGVLLSYRGWLGYIITATV